MSAKNSSNERGGSQNPYAILSSIDDDRADVRENEKAQRKPEELELPLIFVPDKPATTAVSYLEVPSGNPYARIPQGEEDQANLPLPRVDAPGSTLKNKRQGISKKSFQDGCRRIFLQYIPPSEGQLLRPHYRDFISRNEDVSSEDRERLLAELMKYDLFSSGDFKPHFNRGKEIFTSAKLRKIEETIKNS